MAKLQLKFDRKAIVAILFLFYVLNINAALAKARQNN